MPSVLIVDDDEAIRNLLRVLVRRAGFVPTLAEDGEVAINLLADGSFDVVLLDLMMPKVSGYGVLSYLASRHVVSRCVIVLSAAARGDLDALRGHESVAAVLSKPFEATELLHRMFACIGDVATS